MAKRIIGLDISSQRLLAVELENPASTHPKLIRAHAVPLPDGVARDAEVIDIPQVSEALKTLWEAGKFSTKRVVLGVGNQRVLVREHNAPAMTKGQLRQALPYQVQEMLPVPVAETILDFYPIEEVENEMGVKQIRGLLVAAIKDSIEVNVAAVEDAGLKVVGVDLSPFGVVRALSHGSPLKGTHTLVTISAQTTFITVVKDEVPQFVRIVPSGGENLTEALLNLGGYTREEAEDFKTRVGIEYGARSEYSQATSAMLDVLRNIIGSVRSTNVYYENNFEGDPSESVILLGVDSKIPGLAQAVTEYLGIPVVFPTPFEGITVSKNVSQEFLKRWDLDLAIPVGLAIGAR